MIRPPRKREASAEAEPDLKRIDEIIRNSRTLWFALNAALVFAGITLASVQDIAFFVTSERTQLPLVGIDVPVTYFFWAGALLIASFYIYFHLYLEQLWQALGEAPARIDGKPLSERIHPWIVADAALRFRDRLRKAEGEEHASRPRGMGLIGNLATIGLVWLFGPAIVFWFWWRSMPAHDWLMTGWLGLLFVSTLLVACFGAISARASLSGKKQVLYGELVFAAVLVVVADLTVVRTGVVVSPRIPDPLSFDLLQPASANLREAVLTKKTSGWREHHLAEAEFRVRWCRENIALKCVNPLSSDRSAEWGVEQTRAFREVWREHRNAELSSLAKPNLRGKDLRGANLAGIAFEGGNLSSARLEGANLTLARLEGASLWRAGLEGANLRGARLEGATSHWRGSKARTSSRQGSKARASGGRGSKARTSERRTSKARGSKARASERRGSMEPSKNPSISTSRTSAPRSGPCRR